MSNLAALKAVFRIPGFWPISVSIMMLGIAYAIAIPLLSLYALTVVHMSPLQFGVYLASSAISGVAASMVIGKWSDSGVSRERLIMFSLAAGMIGYGIFSQTHDYHWVLLTAVFFMSITGTTFSQMFALTRARFEQTQVQDMTLATNSVRMFFSLAWVFGPVLGAMVLSHFHFLGVFVTTVLLLAVVFGMMIWLPRVGGHAPVVAADKKMAVWRHFGDRRIASSVLAFSLLAICSNLTMMTLPVFVTGVLRGPESALGWLFGLAAGLEIPLMLLTAFVAARVGKSRLIILGAIGYVIYFSIIANAHTVGVLYPNQLLAALAISINMGIAISYFQDLLPGQPGVSTALFSSSFTLGGVLSGVVFASVGSTFGYRGIFAACAILAAIAAMLMASIPKNTAKASL